MSNPTQSTDKRYAQTGQQLSRTFEVLADPHRRHALSYLATMDGNTTSVTDLLKYMSTHTAGSVATLESDGDQRPCFHHIHLAKLDDTGIIVYDARSETIGYDSHPRLEKVLVLSNEMEGTD